MVISMGNESPKRVEYIFLRSVIIRKAPKGVGKGRKKGIGDGM
jgi:hypothetical protein